MANSSKRQLSLGVLKITVANFCLIFDHPFTLGALKFALEDNKNLQFTNLLLTVHNDEDLFRVIVCLQELFDVFSLLFFQSNAPQTKKTWKRCLFGVPDSYDEKKLDILEQLAFRPAVWKSSSEGSRLSRASCA